MKEEIEILATKDGSNTVVHPVLHETYHSINGAINESAHVFINAGLTHCLTQKMHINLLEVGFGTGLNALMTLQYVYNKCYWINYVGIEPFPLTLDVVGKLQYIEQLNAQHLETRFRLMHESEVNKKITIENNFYLTKLKNTLENINPEEKFDLVYFDAFAPNAQPELWEVDTLAKLASFMNPDSVLVTYCAKGQVKRNLKAVGFEIEALAGPPGKREMTRAILKK